jgi:hypothetical protein
MVFKANGIRITDQQFRESKQSKVMVDYIFFIVEYIYQNQTYTYWNETIKLRKDMPNLVIILEQGRSSHPVYKFM